MSIGKETAMKERTAIIFNEKAELIQGNRTKRMHVYVGKTSDKRVREDAERLGISISDYIVYTAIFFKTDDIPHKLDMVLNKLNAITKTKIKKTKYVVNKRAAKDLVEKYKKGDNFMNNAKTNNQNEESKTCQFHLRITQEAHEEIKKRAAAFSMSISDYVVFTTLHFDVMEISKKIDEISTKLDTITNSRDK